MINAAPKDAPADTPKVYEEAKGLPKSDCITVPLTAKLAPTRYITTRGNRTFQMIPSKILSSETVFSLKFEANPLTKSEHFQF